MKKENDYLNNHYDSALAGVSKGIDAPAGGNYQKWKLEIERLGQRYVKGNIPSVGEIMGEIMQDLWKCMHALLISEI